MKKGHGRNRTDNVRFTKPVLYQLSYAAKIAAVTPPPLGPGANPRVGKECQTG